MIFTSETESDKYIYLQPGDGKTEGRGNVEWEKKVRELGEERRENGRK